MTEVRIKAKSHQENDKKKKKKKGGKEFNKIETKKLKKKKKGKKNDKRKNKKKKSCKLYSDFDSIISCERHRIKGSRTRSMRIYNMIKKMIKFKINPSRALIDYTIDKVSDAIYERVTGKEYRYSYKHKNVDEKLKKAQ